MKKKKRRLSEHTVFPKKGSPNIPVRFCSWVNSKYFPDGKLNKENLGKQNQMGFWLPGRKAEVVTRSHEPVTRSRGPPSCNLSYVHPNFLSWLLAQDAWKAARNVTTYQASCRTACTPSVSLL